MYCVNFLQKRHKLLIKIKEFCLRFILFILNFFFLGGANWAYIFLITIHAHFLLLLGAAPSATGCSLQLLCCNAAHFFPLQLLLKTAAADAAHCLNRCTTCCRLLCRCSAAVGCVDSSCHIRCCSSAAAAAAGCVQDNSLYRLSALAGTRTRAHTIGTSQPALSS